MTRFTSQMFTNAIVAYGLAAENEPTVSWICVERYHWLNFSLQGVRLWDVSNKKQGTSERHTENTFGRSQYVVNHIYELYLFH